MSTHETNRAVVIVVVVAAAAVLLITEEVIVSGIYAATLWGGYTPSFESTPQTSGLSPEPRYGNTPLPSSITPTFKFLYKTLHCLTEVSPERTLTEQFSCLLNVRLLRENLFCAFRGLWRLLKLH
jgi:hypothetical protein